MEALTALAPAMAEVDVLVDVRLVQVDQVAPVPLGGGQQGPHPVHEHFALLAASAAQQLAGLFPRQAQPVQGGADGFAAAQATEAIPHKPDQALQRPSRRRVSPGYGWAARPLLRGADFLAKGCVDARAKGGRPPVR